MKIYTKTGDKGKTSLYDGTRIDKNDIRVESYGTVDELNSVLGVARQYCDDDRIREILFKIQRKLFNVGGELATKDAEKFPEKVTEQDVVWLENIIDDYVDLMGREEAFQFIIPGSNLFSAYMHVARTVCRRAERRVLSLSEKEQVSEDLMKFVNRLSDAIYSMARYGEGEVNLVEFDK